VTFNDADFPARILQPLGIHTRHPDDFILDVDGVDPGTLVDAAREDMNHYIAPPLGVDKYIGGLRVAGVPKTADYLERTRVLLTA
jgi:hypothetical protein